jgi:hypothetical protein
MTEMSRSQSKAEYGRYAHLFVGGIEWLLSQWQALTGGEETDLHSHAASGGGSGAIFMSENNLGDNLLDANETAAVSWADGWTVFNEGGFSVPEGAPTRLSLPSAGVYEVFAHGIVAPQVSNELVELVVSIVGENLGSDFTGAQILALELDGSVPFVWRAFEKFPANALVGLSIQAGTHAAAITGLHVGIRREVAV